MNEFIVWDKEEKEFIREFASEVYEPLNDLLANDSYDFLLYIGKTDINNKKIYADSSIVEFEFVDEKLQNSHHVFGYFYFNKTELKYWLKILKCDTLKYGHIGFVNSRFNHIKIIDTIQENKLGLLG